MARVTRAQAAQYKAMRALPRDHEPLLAGLGTRAVTKSVALQLARWTREIQAEFRAQAEDILVAASRAGADLRALAQICAEIRSRTVPSDPDGNDPALDRALFLDTTLDGPGSSAATLPPSAPRWSRRSWTRCRPRPVAGTCGRSRSATTTRWPRRCVGLRIAS
jgi:hypothetical protein